MAVCSDSNSIRVRGTQADSCTDYYTGVALQRSGQCNPGATPVKPLPVKSYSITVLGL